MGKFTAFSLAKKSMRHYRVLTLALIFGVAVTTAVITGALMVGDSVRGSLKKLALDRLGPVTHVVVSPQPFNQSIAERVKKDAAFPKGADAAGMFYVRGSAKFADKVVPGVDVMALSGAMDPTRDAKLKLPVVLSGEVLDVAFSGDAGDVTNFKVLLTLPQMKETSGMAQQSVLMDRSFSSTLRSGIERKVERVAREPGFETLFTISPTQRNPRIAWVPLADMQEWVDAPEKVNAILVTGAADEADLAGAIKRVMTLEDYGIYFKESEDKKNAVMLSRGVFILPTVVEAAHKAAKEIGVRADDATANFVNSIGAGKWTTFYTTGAGVTALADGTTFGEDECAINEWTAAQLFTTVGDEISVDYYVKDRDGNAVLAPQKKFKVAKIFPTEEDRSLIPVIKGVTDKKNMTKWPELPGIKIEEPKADNKYLNKYGATPKIYFNYAGAKKIWGEDAMQTGVRIPADKAAEFQAALLAKLKPADVGMTVLPMRKMQLEAAAGSTDFSGMFIGFSFFLVVSAMIILSALIRLSIDQRARQLGVMAAVGFAPRKLAGLLLREFMLIALIGGVVGLVMGVGYTAIMVYGLRTWWVGATGTSAMELFVSPQTLGTGFFITLILAAITVILSLRKTIKTSAARLMAGQIGPERKRHRSRVKLICGVIAGVLVMIAGGVIALGVAEKMPQQAAFLIAGICLLTAGVLVVWALIVPSSKRAALKSISDFAFRSAGFRPMRGVLTASLVAVASYSLITVASMKQTPPSDPRAKPSGTGGFSLIVSADIPLPADMNTSQGRLILGITKKDDPLLSRAKFTNLRAWKGQDMSCLNMTQPTRPTVMSYPENGFLERFAINKREHVPASPPAPNDAYVYADADSAEYILHMKPGEALNFPDQRGEEVRLQLFETLKSSIFASELLLNDSKFRQFFPNQTGFSVLLVECSKEDEAALAKFLEEQLADYSVTVETTPARLARYQKIANTYLVTFQALGALGLLLGTIGVGVVLLRSVFERRGELALLSAVGFSPGRIFVAIFTEHGVLLTMGILIGAGSAILGVLPAVRNINVTNLAFILGCILAIGLCVVLLATRVALRGVTPASLRAT